MITNMLVQIAANACGLIDNLFIVRLLGKDALAAVVAVNALGDRLLIGSHGLFGARLASTLSNTAALLVLLPGFFRKRKLFRFQIRDGLDLKLVWQAALRGVPSLIMKF